MIFPTLPLSNNLKKKIYINIDLAILPSHNMGYAGRLVEGNLRKEKRKISN